MVLHVSSWVKMSTRLTLDSYETSLTPGGKLRRGHATHHQRFLARTMKLGPTHNGTRIKEP